MQLVVIRNLKALFFLLSVSYLICSGCAPQSSTEATATANSTSVSKGILVVAQDNRPVNIDYPLYLATDGEITISDAIHKKTFAERIETIENELKTKKFSSLVLSLDNLLYGGLMESRVVEKPLNEAEKQKVIQLLEYIKENKITAYGFTSAQRVTTSVYSSKDLEKYNNSMIRNDLLTKGNFMSSAQTSFVLHEDDSTYYQHRANKLRDTIFLFKEASGYFKELYVGQDDTQPSGIQKYELHSLKKAANNEDIHFVNGIDEMTALLIYKVKYNKEKPKVYIHYTSEADFSRTILPYEGVTLENLLIEKQQMFDFEIVDLEMADYVWIIHNGKTFNREVVYDLLKTKKTLMVTDLNSSNYQNQLLTDLFQNNPQAVSNLDVYCSWNTASNMIGLTLSQAFLIKENPNNQLLIEKRILKDYLYVTRLNQEIQQIFKEEIVDPYNIEHPAINQYIQSEMNKFLENDLKTSTRVEKVTFPWKRFFEITIDFTEALN